MPFGNHLVVNFTQNLFPFWLSLQFYVSNSRKVSTNEDISEFVSDPSPILDLLLSRSSSYFLIEMNARHRNFITL